jgi:Flp pilus assembly protein TadG
MTSRPRPAPERRPGAAATELAILLPFLALMFVVAVDFCRVFFQAQTVQGCARAGALYASGAVPGDPSQTPADQAVQAAVAEGASLSPPVAAADVTVTTAGNQVTVTVVHRFTTITGFPGVPGTLNVTRSVTMNVAPKAPGQ